jgi:hypothetical protein
MQVPACPLQAACVDDPLQELPRPRFARALKICAGGPSSRIVPWSRKHTWLAMSRAKPIPCVAITIVMPAAASSRITTA